MRILSYIALALFGALFVFIVFKLLASIPDMVRYIRIRSM